MQPTRSAGPSAIYANILVNSFQQTLISFFEATLGKENEARSAQPDNPADALATAVFVLGPEKGYSLCRKLDGVQCLIVDKEGKMILSPNLKTW